MAADPFTRLAPFIQEYIWKAGWTEIRSVQAAACAAILDSDDHVLIASGTASGKTEAAFLPVLTSLYRDPPASIGALYIGPLKALINDQFYRLDGLLEESGIPVGAWHGDVTASQKKKTVREARGILQITPESLEGLFLRRTSQLTHLFSNLRFVVIDEAHAFMGDERGRQVLCLLERLERVAHVLPRRIGLSATLGDFSMAQAWLRGNTARGVQLINDTSGKRRIHLALEHYTERTIRNRNPVAANDISDDDFDNTLEPLEAAPELYNALYEHSLGKKSLIFSGSRQSVEEAAVALRELADQRGTQDIYHVHHGSVATAFREDAERAMREPGVPACTVATLTLELGIDLGQLERVLQVGPPHSVSSFVQRLGRTGRRGNAGEMIFYTLEREPDPQAPPHQRLPWSLLKSVAIIQLYLEERWVEPTPQPRFPFSLLVHQTLGALEQYGESAPRDLAARVLTLSPFAQVTQQQYRALLEQLLASDHLQRTDEGGLILGLAGERVVQDWHFFAVFPDKPEYAVFNGSVQIGTVDAPPQTGQLISLVGRAWQVVTVDEKRNHVFVKRQRGKKKSAWSGGFPGNTHRRVVEKMRQVLESDTDYPYLQTTARRRLQDARELARDAGLLSGMLHQLSPHQTVVLPWQSSRVEYTMRVLAALQPEGAEPIGIVNDTPYSFTVTMSAEEFCENVRNLPPQQDVEDQMRAAFLEEPSRGAGKFDDLLPPELLADAYVADQLDVAGAMEALEALLNAEE